MLYGVVYNHGRDDKDDNWKVSKLKLITKDFFEDEDGYICELKNHSVYTTKEIAEEKCRKENKKYEDTLRMWEEDSYERKKNHIEDCLKRIDIIDKVKRSFILFNKKEVDGFYYGESSDIENAIYITGVKIIYKSKHSILTKLIYIGKGEERYVIDDNETFKKYKSDIYNSNQIIKKIKNIRKKYLDLIN